MNDENALNILLEHNKKFDQSKYIVLSKLLKTIHKDMTTKESIVDHIQHELDILRFKLIKDL
jgi:hypothetical protein